MVNHKVSNVTNDGVFDGYLDGVLLGAALGTVEGNIIRPANSLSLGHSLRSLHGSFRRI